MAKEKIDNKETIDIAKLKKELTEYVDKEIKNGFINEIEKTNKRFIKEKNKKILSRNIFIIVLLAICVFLSYELYKTGYFNRFLIKIDTRETVEKEDNISNDSKEEIKNEVTLDDLIKKYGNYLNNVVISENCDYLNEYYGGNLTAELKNYIAFNSINIDKIEIEDDYNIISDELLKEKYEEIFSDEYTSKTFKYDDINIKYISSLKSYITSSIVSLNKTNIKREILDIKENDESITITTVEGLIKDKKLYNIITNEEIKEYDNKKLSNYEGQLNKVEYTFDSNGKLLNIK